VAADASFAPPTLTLSPAVGRAVLWHPFQLWIFSRVHDLLRLPLATEAVLRGPEVYVSLAADHVTRVPRLLTSFAQDPAHHEYLRVLALLLLVEPLVRPWLNLPIREGARRGRHETFEDYDAWRRAEDGARLFDSVGMPLERIEHWYRELAIQAALADPLEAFRPLIRHASRDKRAYLKGAALWADKLYDTAEVLRRYAELYHGCTWIEEDDARHGPRGAVVKQVLYGAPRTGDFDRTVFRRLVRDHDLDPQARMTWFVEGETEMAFVPHWAELHGIDLGRAGIEMMNVRGVGGITSDRLRELLERYGREEAFAFISLDEEDRRRDPRGEHLRTLRKYARDRLLITGYRVWHPDFEQANFTFEELAGVANALAVEKGASVRLTADVIQNEMNRPNRPNKTVFKAITDLWGRAQFYVGKGEELGRALAAWAVAHPAPPAVAEEGLRPIESCIWFLLRTGWRDYPLTSQRTKVDANGQVVERPVTELT